MATRAHRLSILLFAAVLLAGACGGDEKEAGGGAEHDDLDDPEPVEGFYAVELDKPTEQETMTVLVPEGWEKHPVFDSTFMPVDGHLSTDLSYDTGCPGLCETRSADEWREYGEEGLSNIATNYDVTIVSDEDRDDGRVVRFEGMEGDDPIVILFVQRWADDTEHFLTCGLGLFGDDIDEDLVSATEEACFATTASFLP